MSRVLSTGKLWPLIGCTNNHKPDEQVDTTLDVTTTQKFPLQVAGQSNLAFQMPANNKPGIQFVQTGGGQGPLMVPLEKVMVPWGWKRIYINDTIVYFR